MICYIKDKKTFKTKYAAHAEYDVTLCSIYDEASVITIPAGDVLEGDFVYVDGYLGVVREIEVKQNIVLLNCGSIETIFGRLLFEIEPTLGIETFIKNQIESEFKNSADFAFNMPFLRVQTHSDTAEILHIDVENKLWSLADFIRKARRLYSIHTEFSLKNNVLNIDIGKRNFGSVNIDAGVGGVEVIEQSASIGQLAKISALAKDSGEISDWYLLESGEISRDINIEGRAIGGWEAMVFEDAEQAEKLVAAKFAENSKSHLIEFATNRRLDFCGDCVVRTAGGRLFRSYISAIQKKSGDERIFYKAGELRLTIGQALRNKFAKRRIN